MHKIKLPYISDETISLLINYLMDRKVSVNSLVNEISFKSFLK